MKYLQTFKESFDFERQPIMDLQEFLPDYQKPKYWKFTRNVMQEDIDKGIIKPNQTRLSLYWKVEKISDNEYKFISLNLYTNKIHYKELEKGIIEIILKDKPDGNHILTPSSTKEIEEFEFNLRVNKFNI